MIDFLAGAFVLAVGIIIGASISMAMKKDNNDG